MDEFLSSGYAVLVVGGAFVVAMFVAAVVGG